MHGDMEVHSILRLKEKDAADLSSLEKECFSTSWTTDQYGALLRDAAAPLSDAGSLPSWMAFGVRTQEGGLDAYISLGLDAPGAVLEIHNIAVRKQLRRKGLAWTLLRHSLQWARSQGFERCLLEVGEGNAAALALYAKAGFVVLGRRKKYYADTGEDAIVMTCALTEF